MAHTDASTSWDGGYEPDHDWLDLPPVSPRQPSGGVPGRRTVTIRGQGSERYRPPATRRPAERRHERAGFRPDRVAMWAVLLGVMLILVAVASAHAATF